MHRVVLTGGPGAGKTAIIELVRRMFCRHVLVLPESAGLLFRGGFPRSSRLDQRRAAQRAIYHVQRELEATTAEDEAAVVLCDRGTVDGSAYWPGPDDFWDEVGSSPAAEYARYARVIHLRVPSGENGYDVSNPLRIETPEEARIIDERILRAWGGHPDRHVIDATPDFLEKAHRTFALLLDLLPSGCLDAVREGMGAAHARGRPADF
jgi:predicted ATPase